MKTLIIDDSPVSRRILRLILKANNISTLEAANGRQALKTLELNRDLDCAFIDWCMSKMSGYEFIKRVKADERFKKVKLIMVTACDIEEDIEKIRAFGIDDILYKPISRKIVEDKLKFHGLN